MKEIIQVFFRSASMFRIMMWIHDKKEPQFYQKECQLGANANSDLPRHLYLLERAGMIVKLEREEGMRKQFWERTDSPYWGVVHTFLETMQEIELGEVRLA